MKKLTMPLPLLGLFTGTRAMGAAGLALLLADKLDQRQRKAVGWTLLATGVVTTIPLLMLLFSKADTTCNRR